MFDNLRDDSESKPFFQDDSDPGSVAPRSSAPELRRAPASSGGRILGMTAVQRFVLSVMLLVMVCVLGVMFLLITEKIGIFF